jgi:hypothetical protein
MKNCTCIAILGLNADKVLRRYEGEDSARILQAGFE